MPNDKPETNDKPFGLSSLTMLVIASMVGAGVFTTSGYTLGAVGSPAAVMLCWSIGGVIAICGSVAYGRLARLMPQSGGEYLYLRRNVHPLAGFLAGWISLTAGFSGAIAAAAVAFENYAVPDSLPPVPTAQSVPGSLRMFVVKLHEAARQLPEDVVAIAVVLLCGAAHGLRGNVGRFVQNVVVVLKITVLAAFLCLACLKLNTHSWHVLPLVEQPTGLAFVTAVATSVVWISLSYAGFNAAVYVAAESAEASRVVPKALVVGTVLVTFIYLFLNAVFVTSAPPEELIWQEDVAAVSARSLGGARLEFLVRGAVVLGLLSSVSGMILSGPRVYARMADDGVFPRFFAARDGGIQKSVALQTLLAIVLILVQRLLVEFGILSTSFLGLLIYLGTTLSISSALCVATLFFPSVRAQDPGRPVWVSLLSAVYVVATLLAVVLLVVNHEQDKEWRGLWHISGAVLTFATGLVAWRIFGKPADIASKPSNV